MSATFSHRIRVRFYECDPQGIVWHANFLNYLDVAHTELMREIRGPYSGVLEAGLEVVVAEVRLHFRRPARFDDELNVDLDVIQAGTTSVTLGVLIRRGGKALVEGEGRWVYIDGQSGEKTPIPDAVRSALAPYAREEANLAN